MVPPGGNWRDLPPDVARQSMGQAYYSRGGRSGWWRRLAWDRPCPTLLSMPNHSATALCHPELLRPLSVAEYLRIQRFPDDWAVCGTPADRYRLAGNAVPVGLGVVAGRVAARLLDQIEEEGAGDGAYPRFRLVNVRACVRARRQGADSCGEKNFRPT